MRNHSVAGIDRRLLLGTKLFQQLPAIDSFTMAGLFYRFLDEPALLGSQWERSLRL